VAFKKKAGRMHYEAMLKYIITPDELERVFQTNGSRSTSKLQADSDWPYLNKLPLHEVHPENLQRLILAAMTRGYSMQTVVHIRNVISAVFTHAKRTNYYAGDNPARLVELPERTRRTMPTLTLNQVRDVFRLMRYPEKVMMLIAILTGMNVTEICGLKWKCVNLTGACSGDDGDAIPPISIAIKNQCYRGECAEVRVSRIRNLAIPELLLPILLRLRARPNYSGPDDFVLVSRFGTPINPMNITARRLRPIANELRIPGLSWSLLRKAHNSLAAELGAEFEYLLAKMVHSDSPEEFRGDGQGKDKDYSEIPRE
jgi:integrase